MTNQSPPKAGTIIEWEKEFRINLGHIIAQKGRFDLNDEIRLISDLLKQQHEHTLELLDKEINIAKTPMAIHYPKDYKFEERGLVQFNAAGRTLVALDDLRQKIKEL